MEHKPKRNATKDGPPRWTYATGALVAIGTLVWGVVSHFVPPNEPPTPASTPAVPAVSVSGTGNVGIGTMTGGQITVGAVATPTQQSSEALPKHGSKP